MPKVSPIQSSFNGGEISPLCYGRVDVPRYKESLAICQNYLPLLQGPITRRPGTEFIFYTKFGSASVSRLIPFEVSTTQSYVLEFGDQYIRFYKNGAIITDAPNTITAITQANPGVVTSASHGFSNGTYVVISGVVGMIELNNRQFTVANSTTNTFTLVDAVSGLAVDTTGYGAYVSGGTAGNPHELTSVSGVPYTAADIPAVQFAQSNDVLYLTHPSYPPQKLTRVTDTSWTFLPLTGILASASQVIDGPYLDEDEQGTTFAVSFQAGGSPPYWLVTASALAGINNGVGFVSTDVGRLVRMKDPTSSKWLWNKIIAYVDNKNIHVASAFSAADDTATFAPDGGGTSFTAASWRMGFWSDTTGYPAAICFHQDRLVFGGTADLVSRFDGGKSSDYSSFAPSDASGTIAASHAYNFLLSSNDLNAIRWMTSDEQGIIIGTTGGEWIVSSADSTSALSPLSVSAKRSTSFGSANIQAVQSGKCTIFVQRGARKVRELNYYFDVNGFRAEDLTQLAEHITNTQITTVAVQKSPQPILWMTRNDGVLLAMTYERDLDALKVGWSRHIMGGAYSSGNPVVESVCVVDSADGVTQDVYLIVKRTVNGFTVRYIELLTQLFDDYTALTSAWFVDCGLQYSGAATASITGLSHLNGQIVSVLADGTVEADRAVINGKISLDVAASVVTVGLKYNSDGQKLRTDAGSADGTAMGKTRRTHRLGLQFLNTLGFQLGNDFNTLDTVTLDNDDDGNFDEASPLFTGITTQLITTDYDFDNMICWRQNQPLPGTILGLYPQMNTQDRG